MDLKITFPGVSQEDFEHAFLTLEDCKKESAKDYGFHYPFFAPGGKYGAMWWQLDSSLALCGYKWYDQKFCETALKNFIESQCENGRICLYGYDILPDGDGGGEWIPQKTNVSSLPKIFDAAYHVLLRSSDIALKKAVYAMFQKYLAWWFQDRQDKNTGLITSVFEETFIPYLGSAGEYAAVDTNVEVAVGCHYTALLAKELGEAEKEKYYLKKKDELAEAINRYLWNEERGAYFAYSIIEGKLQDRLMASAFYPLRLGIAPTERREKLLTLLQDDAQFNWNGFAVTSVSRQDPCFTTTRGAYQGNASWSGNVWTLVNEMIVRGLLDCGENRLAAELALKTIRVFNHNCTEFANPFDGTGHGVELYAWTASQYLEMIMEVIFGLKYDAKTKGLSVMPNLPPELEQAELALHNLPLPSGDLVNVRIHGSAVWVDYK